jgi:hypothetical protein
VADQEKDNKIKEYSRSAYIGETIPNSPSDFREETACELAGPVSLKKSPETALVNREETSRELAVVPVSLKKVPVASAVHREETATEIAAPVVAKKTVVNPSLHREETAAEIAAPAYLGKFRDHDDVRETEHGEAQAGTGMGFLALALSIISLFVMPILFGAAGIVLGFIARARGANTLGAWAIGIGVVSIVIGIFILPFF